MHSIAISYSAWRLFGEGKTLKIGMRVAAAVSAAVMIPLASAHAANASDTIRPTTLDTAGIKAYMASHNGVLSNEAAQRFGLRPNTVYVPSAAPLAAAVHTSQVRAAQAAAAPRQLTTWTLSRPPARPNSASGCRQNVCIEIIGVGLTVDEWSTFAYTTGYQCSFSVFWMDGEVEFSGDDQCGDGVLGVTWSNPGDFNAGTELCNTWLSIAGKPCETVG